ASRAIHKRRRKSKKIDMPARWYPSRASGGHVEDSGNKGPKTVPFESVLLTGKAVHIQLYKQE
ncbi:MAG: hypothetical protein Q4F24_06805, partial [Eubacteriales bacterium]|nr:hypothetical protein [Eubacteriales bacterium]